MSRPVARDSSWSTRVRTASIPIDRTAASSATTSAATPSAAATQRVRALIRYARGVGLRGRPRRVYQRGRASRTASSRPSRLTAPPSRTRCPAETRASEARITHSRLDPARSATFLAMASRSRTPSGWHGSAREPHDIPERGELGPERRSPSRWRSRNASGRSIGSACAA